ncbi:hypothetical protein T440DRAFT_483448 [Plenodomus tracheiphilus IPT5]|uniref:ribonuclease H n=1 Tax=Plenodomus tracheiphilus IPT5 TaxID=1408161 RepID=A0A6A7ATB1_9PLEO|nr:hypothetical protein T440DRAFT_483448 [Plenodomus tracheiphilus IPT5]
MPGANSITSTTSSGKRKRDTSAKFYAVKVGRKPGVYQTWPEAHAQVEGYKDPIFKKFDTYAEAEAMVKGGPSTGPKSGKTKTKYYGVAVGHVPGVYTDWSQVQAQIKGATGVKQKSFATFAEAQAYVNEFKRDKSVAISLRGDLSESSLATGKTSKGSENPPKKQKKENAPSKPTLTNGDIVYEPGMGPLPLDAEDGFDRTIKLDVETGQIRVKTEEELHATKKQPTGDFTGPIVVYTDGSSLGNGRAGAVAGVGVYFGPLDSRNVSEALRGDRQTNQRAELTAVARALDHIPIDRSTEIVTDSNYSIKCLTEWFPKWERNHWRNAAGRPVENRDLIEPIVARIREREMCRAKTAFRWIKGHANDPGNMAADELAVLGSRNSTPELRGRREFSLTLNTPTRLHYFKEGKVEPHEVVGGIDVKSKVVDEDGDEDFDKIFEDLAAEQDGKGTEGVAAADGVEMVVADDGGGGGGGGADADADGNTASKHEQQQQQQQQDQDQDQDRLERILGGDLQDDGAKVEGRVNG